MQIAEGDNLRTVFEPFAMSGNFGRRSEKVAVSATPRAVEAKGGDKRWANRRKTETPGLVYLEGSSAVIACLVRDVSTTGAKIQMQENWMTLLGAVRHLPEHLTLVIRHDRVAYDCKIMRRNDRELGVKFLSAPRAIAAGRRK